MALPAFDMRPASEADAEAINAVFIAGFESFRTFAPPRWQPPEPTIEHTRERLRRPGSLGIVATAGAEVIGVGLHSSGNEPHPDGVGVEGLAHVGAVFVAEPWWGRGVATALLAALVANMRAAGYREARLYTPAGQARARAFYAREGWYELAGPSPALGLGLDVVELRRGL